jgi:serine phosphatase RsbU (regulator of sigma subunit)
MAEESPKRAEAKQAATKSVEDPVLKFVVELGRAIEFYRLYPPNHPYVTKSFASAFESAQKAFQKSSPFTFGVSADGFFIQDEKLKDVPSVVSTLGVIFKRLSISGVAVGQGVTEDELSSFIRLISERDLKSLKGEEAQVSQQEPLTQFPNIEINTFSYEQITTKEGRLFQKVRNITKTIKVDGEQLLQLLLAKSSAADLEGAGGASLSTAVQTDPQTIASFVASALKKASQETGMSPEEAAKPSMTISPEKLELLRSLSFAPLEKIATSLAIHRETQISELKEHLENVIRLLPAHLQVLLYGTEFKKGEAIDTDKIIANLSKDARAKMIVREMRKNPSPPDATRNMIMRLLASPNELGTIAELITKHASSLASKESTDAVISRLFAALQSGIKVEFRGIAVVVEPDKECAEIAKSALLASGMDVQIFSDPVKALDSMREKPPDLLVTAVKLPGLHGIDLLSAVRRLPKQVPAIVCTKYKSFRKEFEIVTYPSYRFLIKPVQYADLVRATDELLPRKGGESAAEQVEFDQAREDELQSAREIQQSLLPHELPKLENFDIAGTYRSCREVGGDYYDIFPLPASGGYGLFIADVAGKGIPAAMITVLLRSLLRSAVTTTQSAGETLIQLNRLLSKEIREGLFVSAVYIIIEPQKRTATVCSAGHCPALLWKRMDRNTETEFIEHTGMVLGLGDTPYFVDNMKEQIVQMQPESGVLLYTDGVTEAMNATGEEYGQENLEKLVSTCAKRDAHLINEAVVESVSEFTGARPQQDDITLLTIKCIS